MIIEDISYSDKYNLVELIISKEKFFIDYDLYHELKLTLNSELDFKTYKRILANDDYNRAKNFALNKISYSQKSTYEIKKVLADKGFKNDSIDKVIDFLNNYGFLDDKTYVKTYINDKDQLSNWSRNKIGFMLKKKHIDQNLIDDYLCLISDEREVEKARFFADKKIRDDYSMENKQKVFRHLASKGFDYDTISKVLGEFFKWNILYIC